MEVRMIRRFLSATLAAALLTMPAFVSPIGAATKKRAAAKTAVTKPKDATGQCEDGSYTRAKTQQGACSSHGGVKTWYGEPAAATEPATSETTSRVPTPKRTTTGTATEPAAVPQTTATPATKAPATTAPAGAAANATAKCKDGTYSYAKHHSGACSHHGGVAEWYK